MLPSNETTTMSPPKQQVVPRRRRILPMECLRDMLDFLQVLALLRLSSVSWLFYGSFLKHGGRFTAIGRRLRTVVFDRNKELEKKQRREVIDERELPVGFSIFLRLAQKNGGRFAFATVPQRFSTPPEEFQFGQIKITVANNAFPDLSVYNRFMNGAVSRLHGHTFCYKQMDSSKLNKRKWRLMEKFQRFRKAFFELTDSFDKISAFLDRQWVKDTPELCFILYRIDYVFSMKKSDSALKSLANWLHLPPHEDWPEEVGGERTLRLFIYGRHFPGVSEIKDALVRQLEQKFLSTNTNNVARKYRVLVKIQALPNPEVAQSYLLESFNQELLECKWEVDGRTIISRRPSGTSLKPFEVNVDRTRCLEFNYTSHAFK